MSIPNKQIGWSNESNLLWEVSWYLDRLIAVTAANATNPNDLYEVVGPSSIFLNGNSVATLPTEFQNLKIRLFRNGSLLDFGDQGLGDPFYTYDAPSAVITLSNEPVTDEKFAVMAYK